MFFCLLAVFFASQTMAADANTGSADENVANTSDLTAEQIVERNIAARGGAAAWHKIQSISMTGKLDAGHERIDGGKVIAATSPKSRADKKAELRKVAMNMGDEAADKIIRLPFQMDLKRPLKSRIEVPFNGQTAVQVYDGTQGWKLRPYLGRHEVEPFNPQEAKIASEQQELDGPLLDHVAKGINATGALAVFNDHGNPNQLGQFVGDRSTDGIRRRSCAEGDHDTQRPGGVIRLRVNGLDGRERDAENASAEQSASKRVH